jgi:hypothetical protein
MSTEPNARSDGNKARVARTRRQVVRILLNVRAGAKSFSRRTVFAQPQNHSCS